MAKKATELSDLHIRRLKHHVTASGEPRAKRYSVGGVSGLYIQCSPPSGSNRVGSKQWIQFSSGYRKLGWGSKTRVTKTFGGTFGGTFKFNNINTYI